MEWPQKLNAVAQHVHVLGGKAEERSSLSSDMFMVDAEIIKTDQTYADLINLMNLEAGDLRAMLPRTSFPYAHKTSKVPILKGNVEKGNGMVFQDLDSMWQCKIPDRAAFHKWGKCITKKANRETQKFVMLFLAKYGAPRTSYENYPLDDFFGINEPEGLTLFLNNLQFPA